MIYSYYLIKKAYHFGKPFKISLTTTTSQPTDSIVRIMAMMSCSYSLHNYFRLLATNVKRLFDIYKFLLQKVQFFFHSNGFTSSFSTSHPMNFISSFTFSFEKVK